MLRCQGLSSLEPLPQPARLYSKQLLCGYLLILYYVALPNFFTLDSTLCVRVFASWVHGHSVCAWLPALGGRIRAPGTGVRNGCELYHMSAGDQTKVPSKNNSLSQAVVVQAFNPST